MRFDEGGMFWEPFRYVAAKKERADPKERAPRIPPPIPETGWKARAEFPSLASARLIALDTETYDPDLREKGPGVRRDGYLVGVSVATDDGFKRYYPFAHSVRPEENLDRDQVLAWLRDELARPHQPKVGANILYDLDYLAAAGVRVAGKLFDVQYAGPLIYEYHRSYSLEALADRHLGEHKETSLLYKWLADAYGGKPEAEQRANIWRAPPSLVGPYAEADAELPLRIWRKQVQELRAMASQEMDLFPILEMECSLIPILLGLRQRGVRISIPRCQQLDDELTAKIDTTQSEVGIDVYAAAQIQQMCDAEGIEYPRTEKGAPSFVKKWLESHSHPKLRAVSELRKLHKLRDTFVRGSMIGSQINGRVHCSLHPLRSDDYGTVSGRFSSSDPNLQQIPVRDEYWGPRIRSAFIPDEDLLWGKNDLSQIEFRLGVHYGVGDGVEEVRAAYRADRATDFYNVVVGITGLLRRDAKSIALGTLYGMGPLKFSITTGIDLETSLQMFAQFNERLPFMRATYNRYSREAEMNGYVRTIGGRICHLDEGFEHKALNRKLQGSCADWMKRSMLEAHQRGLFDVLPLYLTVHDELDYGIPRTREGAEAARELHDLMCNAYQLNIPVLAGCDIGPSWGELQEIDPPESLSIDHLKGA